MKIEGTMRNLLEKVSNSPDAEFERIKMMIGNDDIHYPQELLSGCRMLEKCIDATTMLNARRDNGEGGMLASVQAEYVSPGKCGDTIEVIVKIVKEGTRSRVYEFEMYNIIDFDQEAYRHRGLEEPKLMVKGSCVVVNEEARK